MAHKNDYTCIVYFPDDKPKKWTYVHNLRGFAGFLDQKHPGWKYFNVYDRRTAAYLKRFYPNSPIPGFLALIFLLGQSFFLTFNNPTHALTFINGFNNSATIWTPSDLQKGGVL